jgi:predicted TIM-barrel fold metal-dependent hydrolase
MDKSRGMGRNGPWLGGQLKERPSRIFRRHVSVVPYPEDDTVELAGRLGGTDCLVMGSDWPHAEGTREPAEFYDKVAGLGDEERRRFLRDNGLALLGAS